MNAPFLATLPRAPREDWPTIAMMFRGGADTYQIARHLRLPEAHVANALNAALRSVAK